MDSQNIIDLYDNITDLDKELNSFLSLTFDQRKRADSACLGKYGCTNIERYNKMKSILVKDEPIPDTITNEGFKFKDDSMSNEVGVGHSEETLFNKILLSNTLQKQDQHIIIINDFMDDTDPDYNLDDLRLLYNRFVLLPDNYKDWSNNYSLELWGQAVPDMFNYMAAKLQSLKTKENIINNTDSDRTLTQYKKEMQIAANKKDFLEFCIYKINCYAKHDTLYESVITEKFANDIQYPDNYDKDIPAITPYFTPDEFNKNNTELQDVLPLNYILIDDGKKYFNVIHDIQTDMKLNPDNKQIDEKSLLALGWNPYVNITAETMKYARNKQLQWINRNESCNIIDISKYKTNLLEQELNSDPAIGIEELSPIYIVLSRRSNPASFKEKPIYTEEYYHAGISFDPTLTEIYSFNLNHCPLYSENEYDNNIKIEDISSYEYGMLNDAPANIKVYTFFIPENIKQNIVKGFKWYLDKFDRIDLGISNIGKINANTNNKVPYSDNIICAQLVDIAIRLANINIDSNIFTNSFIKNSGNLYLVYNDIAANFDWKYLDNKAKALMTQANFPEIQVKEESEILEDMKKFIIESFSVKCKDNDKISNILKSIRENLIPQPCIIENKFDSANWSEDKINIEYNNIIKELSILDISKIDMMKENVNKLYSIMAITSDKANKENNENLSELVESEASYLNTYINIIKSADKKYTLSNSLKESSYFKEKYYNLSFDSDYRYIKNYKNNIL